MYDNRLSTEKCSGKNEQQIIIPWTSDYRLT